MQSASKEQKITTFLWFDDKAEEAAHFYASVFDDARVIDPVRTPDEMRTGAEKPMVVTFEIHGQRFMGLNGGPRFRFSEAISLFVSCDDQAEIDRYWAKLIDGGGEPQQCGWLKDKYGLSWQIIPKVLMELMGDPDKGKSARVMQAMLGMQKFDISALHAAHTGS